MNEIKRYLNENNSKTEGLLKCYQSPVDFLTKYAFIASSFDSNSLSYGNSGVVYDGYDSYVNKITVSFYLAYYNFSNSMINAPVKYYNNSTYIPD